MYACQLLLHIAYRLLKPFASSAPSESLLADRERAFLHPIQLVKPVHLGNYVSDQSTETVVRQHRAPEFFRQTRSGLRHRGYGNASENIVQKFQLESAPYRFGNDPDARAREKRGNIRHESVEACRPATRPQRGKQFSRNVSNNIQYDSPFFEDWIGDFDEAGEVLLLHHPLERSHDDYAPGCRRRDAALVRDPSCIAWRERQRSIVVQVCAQGPPVLVGDGRE